MSTFTKIFYFILGFLASLMLFTLTVKSKIYALVWFEIASSIMLAWYFKKRTSMKETKWRYSFGGVLWGNGILLGLTFLTIIALRILLGNALV